MMVTLVKGERIGSGSFCIVYNATEQDTGQTVALKKARVSLRVKRTLLQHEAAVIKALHGHPAIPDMFAYGRIEHFELLSMQRYDQCLGDLVSETTPLSLPSVLDVADQLLSALQYIHSHNIVHRDIKPNNIMIKVQGSWDIVLIDFGLAYQPVQSSLSTEHRDQDMYMYTVFGSLSYASLNAHERLQLSYRDDLESLVYTLIYLLKGNLPWTYYASHGTDRGCIRQVHEQKKRFDGSRFAFDVPEVFGTLLDYSRSLSVDTMPDYTDWRRKFGQCTWDGGSSIPWKAKFAVTDKHARSAIAPPPPIEPGQVVSIQLLSAVTIEEYTGSSDGNPSYIHDPSFVSSEWQTRALPVVILKVTWDEWSRLYHFSAAAIARSEEGCIPGLTSVPILGPYPPSNVSRVKPIITKPAWPLANTFCYVFQRPTKLYCLPAQAKVHFQWTVDLEDVKLLLTPRSGPSALPLYDAIGHSDVNVHNDAMLYSTNAYLFANISTLDMSDLIARDGYFSIDCGLHCKWHNECVKAAKQWDHYNGKDWSSYYNESIDDEAELSNSYMGYDHSVWESLCQQERDATLTLSPLGVEGHFLTSVLEDLDTIVLQE